MYEFSENLASIVQAARIARGLTQDELAEHIGVTGKSISNIERGIANPEFESIYLLFRYLGINVNDVFFPEHGDTSNLQEQFHHLIDTCTQDELEMLLSINREILIHTRKKDSVGEVQTVSRLVRFRPYKERPVFHTFEKRVLPFASFTENRNKLFLG